MYHWGGWGIYFFYFPFFNNLRLFESLKASTIVSRGMETELDICCTIKFDTSLLLILTNVELFIMEIMAAKEKTHVNKDPLLRLAYHRDIARVCHFVLECLTLAIPHLLNLPGAEFKLLACHVLI